MAFENFANLFLIAKFLMMLVNILADDTQDLTDIIWRRIELCAAQILTTGRVRYRLDGGEYEEFGFGPGVPNVCNPPIPWDQPTPTEVARRRFS